MFKFCKGSEHFGSPAVVDANWNHTAASKQKHKESAINTLKSRLRNNREVQPRYLRIDFAMTSHFRHDFLQPAQLAQS